MPDRQPGDREERLDLYRVAVEEYRFQVQLNWDRAKYLLGFNVAIIGVGTGLVQLTEDISQLNAGVFVVGMVAAALSVFAVGVQHSYYEVTRTAMTDQATALNLGTRSVTTTPGARGDRTRWWQKLGRVQTILYVLLAICAVVDGLGIRYVLTRSS